MAASIESIATRAADGALMRFVGARDLPPDLQIETLELLFRSTSGELRQRAIRAGAALLPDDALVAYLREEADDVLRNAGLEMLKLRGRRSFDTAVTLLADPDTDVVLQAVLALDATRDPRAWSHLRPLLQHDDVNVVQAAITAAGHLAGDRGCQDLIAFLSREPWLQVAAIQALGDLRSTPAIAHLAPLLGDPFLQPFVAETLARIGGVSAYRALARFWLTSESDLDARSFLELLASMLMQLETPPREPGLRDAVGRYLLSEDGATAVAAAWCVASLGAGEDRDQVLDLIAASVEDPACPPSIRSQSDLAGDLIRRDPPLRDWGYSILARYPDAIAPEVAARYIAAYPPTIVRPVGEYMARRAEPLFTIPLLALWIERLDERADLVAAVRRQSRNLTECLARCEIAPADHVPLAAAMGLSPAEIVAIIEPLADERRWGAVAAVHSRAVVKRLPWREWLAAANREVAARAMAQAASKTGCRELLPLLRAELAARPQREIVEAVADLRDTESVAILMDSLQHGSPFFRAAVFEALGRIGGTNARMVLRSCGSADSPDWNHACRALAMCATDADTPLLRAAADSSDLSVRLAVINPLGSFPDAENLRVLRRLLFDPSAAVAQKAQAALELSGGIA